MKVKTRFAPSPTGFLHIGSLRTALYCYFTAKRQNGIFALRIEDTDKERQVEGAVDAMVVVLNKLGITPDEGPTIVDGEVVIKGDHGPYIQSERLEIYGKYINQLLDQGDAYRCFCSRERLSEVRKQQQIAKMQTKYDRACCKLSASEVEEKLAAGESSVVRMKVPEGESTFTDEVYGTITINNSQIDDQVLLKSDGFPTYHMAVVVDDHLMEITHVVRGEEWIPSTPKHVILYKMLGWEMPAHAHLPLILNPDKSKLSKRQGDVSVEDFLQAGYLPDALINFVSLLGFNPTGDREIYTREELQDTFELSKVNKSGAVFDREKLSWMNGQYIKTMPAEELLTITQEIIPEANDIDENVLNKILSVEKERISTVLEFSERFPMYTEKLAFEAEELVWKKADLEDAKLHLTNIAKVIDKADESDFATIESIEGVVRNYIDTHEYKNGNVLWPLRVALSGAPRSPGPFELLWVLGKDLSTSRINDAISKLT
jgi:nondiscriminating glutamyl-tRNA synthetase